GIKYTYNQGHPNTDNPKLAARYFLNAIDRVEALKEKYQKTLDELERNIPMVFSLANKSFEKEIELVQMKSELSKLEREIALRIQENQMKQNGAMNDDTLEVKEHNKNDLKETPVINMVPNAVKPIQTVVAIVNGAAVKNKDNYQQSQELQSRTRRNSRLRL
ncbi:MAG TPA: hypothetical protein VF622_00625, partial [Segetibacter sp.]